MLCCGKNNDKMKHTKTKHPLEISVHCKMAGKGKRGMESVCSQTWPTGTLMPLCLVGNHLVCLHIVKALTNHLLYSRNNTILPHIHPMLLEYLFSSSLQVVRLHTTQFKCGLLCTSLQKARNRPKHCGGNS